MVVCSFLHACYEEKKLIYLKDTYIIFFCYKFRISGVSEQSEASDRQKTKETDEDKNDEKKEKQEDSENDVDDST